MLQTVEIHAIHNEKTVYEFEMMVESKENIVTKAYEYFEKMFNISDAVAHQNYYVEVA
jgi:4-diphosphocytidyl-2C-methyl-D-erythritol kinase